MDLNVNVSRTEPRIKELADWYEVFNLWTRGDAYRLDYVGENYRGYHARPSVDRKG